MLVVGDVEKIEGFLQLEQIVFSKDLLADLNVGRALNLLINLLF